MDFAIIKIGGKQYKASKGDKLKVEKLNGKEGDAVSLDVLLTSDQKGKKVEIGQPLLDTRVEGKILKHSRGKKVSVTKYKAKTRYKKTHGHRQEFTEIQVQ